jgi:hypothetical protein
VVKVVKVARKSAFYAKTPMKMAAKKRKNRKKEKGEGFLTTDGHRYNLFLLRRALPYCLFLANNTPRRFQTGS